MGLKVDNIKISETKKRIDADVTQSDFWNGSGCEFKIRILSKEPIEADVEDLVNQVYSRKSSWRPGKKNQSLQLDGINATAYIINYQNKEEDE